MLYINFDHFLKKIKVKAILCFYTSLIILENEHALSPWK